MKGDCQRSLRKQRSRNCWRTFQAACSASPQSTDSISVRLGLFTSTSFQLLVSPDLAVNGLGGALESPLSQAASRTFSSGARARSGLIEPQIERPFACLRFGLSGEVTPERVVPVHISILRLFTKKRQRGKNRRHTKKQLSFCTEIEI